MKVRRVVTGHTPDGKAVVINDTKVESGDGRIHNLWGADYAPTFPDDGATHPAPDFFPPIGGFRFIKVTLSPNDSSPMHISDTVDFIYVISGEVWLELDDGEEIPLKPGDTVVQNGTIHAWHNKGSVPCSWVAWMTGAHRSFPPNPSL